MKLYLILPVVFAIAACVQPPEDTKPVVVSSEPLNRPQLNVPDVDQYRARKVEWVVVTPENIAEVFADLRARGEPVVLFGVTEKGYEKIALNTREALNVILQQRAVIDGYRRYYVEVDGVIYEFNQKAK